MGSRYCLQSPEDDKQFIVIDKFNNNSQQGKSRMKSEKIKFSKEMLHNRAAVKIQKVVRGFISRKNLLHKINAHIIYLISNMKANYVRKDIIDYLHVSVLDLEQSGLFEDYKNTIYFKENILKQGNNKFLVNLPAIHVEMPTGKEIYEGFWNLKGKYEGYGILVKSDGSKYEGFWKDGALEGIGRFYSTDGSYYDGNFSKGITCGFGIYIHNDRTRYQGEWQNDQPHGKGKEFFPDGSVFEGTFVNGKKIGNCVYSWRDGSYYVGEILNDYFYGKGRYSWSDGKIYEGDWKDNMLHGKGILRYPDGSFYDGYFLNNQRNGHGKYYWNEFRYFEGTWSNGKQHGKGIYFKNSKAIEGVWNQGKLQKTLNVVGSSPGISKTKSNTSGYASDNENLNSSFNFIDSKENYTIGSHLLTHEKFNQPYKNEKNKFLIKIPNKILKKGL
jgi:hypothetical protein